jgi:hypothetical protein
MELVIAVLFCVPTVEPPGYAMELRPAATETTDRPQRPAYERLFDSCMKLFNDSSFEPQPLPSESVHYPHTIHRIHEKYRQAVAGAYLLVRGEAVEFGSKHAKVRPYEIVIALKRSEKDGTYQFAGMFCVDKNGRVLQHTPSLPHTIEIFDRALKISVRHRPPQPRQ